MNTFISEQRKIREVNFREASARREKIVQAQQRAHQAAGMMLAGLKKLQAAHKELEIRTGDADYPYYDLLDGQPGEKKIAKLAEALEKYREAIQPWETI